MITFKIEHLKFNIEYACRDNVGSDFRRVGCGNHLNINKCWRIPLLLLSKARQESRSLQNYKTNAWRIPNRKSKILSPAL